MQNIAEKGIYLWPPSLVFNFSNYRWHNHLDPSINKKQWSDYEEMQFITAHQSLGNRWAEISKIIKGR